MHLATKKESGTKLIFNYSIRMIDESLTIATGNALAFCGHGLGHTGLGQLDVVTGRDNV